MSNTVYAEEALNCNIGPAHKSIGETDWLVYSCGNETTLVFVSDKGSAAFPFVFTMMVQEDLLLTTGQGNGSKEATAKTYEVLKKYTLQELASLIEETKKVRETDQSP
ncbi:MAG: hypothetical protein H6856_06235 [Rhodospirillales bacterium]|nr:hypothetical protein [Rhodospirillales bacterium]